MRAPRSTNEAMCLQCRRDGEGIDWEWFAPIGEWHPTVDYRDMSKAVALTVQREPYPAPEVSSRLPVVAPNKKAVADLELFAEMLGWSVETTYARGCFPHATTGKPGPAKDSLAARMTRGAIRAVAVYVGGSTWSWETMAVQTPGSWPVRYSRLVDFKTGLV